MLVAGIFFETMYMHIKLRFFYLFLLLRDKKTKDLLQYNDCRNSFRLFILVKSAISVVLCYQSPLLNVAHMSIDILLKVLKVFI